MSVAVAVGFFALAGVAAETGVITMIYLDHAMKELQAERAAEGKEFTRADQCGKRVRPIASSGMNGSAPTDTGFASSMNFLHRWL
jgi:Cu/Ag efflux pump CusA